MKLKLLITVLIIILAVPVFAVDIIVGAKAGYYAWQPFLKDINAGGFNQIEYGKGVLYGPVLGGSMDDFSFSLAVLFGNQSTHWDAEYELYLFDGGNQYVSGTYYFDSDRLDIDAAIGYRVMENLKIFAGYKYLSISSVLNYTELRSPDDVNATAFDQLYLSDMEVNIPAHGPALGLGYSLPLTTSLFFTATLSGLIMNGEFEIKSARTHEYKYNSPNVNYSMHTGESMKIDIDQLGINFEPAIGFKPTDSGLIFTLGFRTQILKTNLEMDDKGKKNSIKAYDKLYGVFVSVLYSLGM